MAAVCLELPSESTVSNLVRCHNGHDFAAEADGCPVCGAPGESKDGVSEETIVDTEAHARAANPHGDQPDLTVEVSDELRQVSLRSMSDEVTMWADSNSGSGSDSTVLNPESESNPENPDEFRLDASQTQLCEDDDSSNVDATVVQATIDLAAAVTDPTPLRKKRDKLPKLPGYRILEELGRGGMGVVYRAFNERSEDEVAIKTLLRMSPTSLQLFKQEFRALADIAHPNLASLHELVSDGSMWCFTMELLEGVHFLEYVFNGFDKLQATEEAAVTDPEAADELTGPQRLRLQEAMQQLVVGLHTLHSNGKLHRDIKPTNVMMTTSGRLVLLDFGLVGDVQEKATPGTILGTPSYMPPEQAAGQIASPASDW